ncbi:MAG: hypothetical protein M3Y22_17315 [Pseudomonadota bacterium]|nr:hypothetical protein [Pseudomonadota bacterium]
MAAHLDPVLLNLRVPLVDAICATVCGEWFEAADLWFEVYRDPRLRSLAAQCGSEASLYAGLLDLAEYFYLGLGEPIAVPPFVRALREKNEPIRAARRAFYDRRLNGRPGNADRGHELMRLHFYREAVRWILALPLAQRDCAAVLVLLARAYAMLGAHPALIALYESRRQDLNDAALASLVDRARRLVARQVEPPQTNLQRFERQHAAGSVFTAYLRGAGMAEQAMA